MALTLFVFKNISEFFQLCPYLLSFVWSFHLKSIRKPYGLAKLSKKKAVNGFVDGVYLYDNASSV